MLFDFLKFGDRLEKLEPQHFLTSLVPVATALNLEVPEGCWWGIQFLDSRYLFSFRDSPAIETYRLESGFRLSISGPCHVEPGLSFWQVQELHFLGWESPDDVECACFWTELMDLESVGVRFRDALNALYTVYGISESCRLVGSNDRVLSELLTIEGTRKLRSDGSVRFSRELIRGRTKEDLR